MHVQSFGLPLPAPTLICVPGLLGGVEDFSGMLDIWKHHFHVLVLDPNFERREQGLSNLSVETLQEISFASSADDIAKAMDEHKITKAYLAGISLGGKIVFDFAIHHSQRLLGALITDVSPGPFAHSELFQFVDKTVTHAPMHLPWADMKAYLEDSIKDRNLRSLIRTQIHYPQGKPPAMWKTGMANFEKMLTMQSINNQYEGLQAVDETLQKAKSCLSVLKAGSLSGISDFDFQKLRGFKSVKLQVVQEATHFLHVTHKDLIVEKTLELLK